MTGTYKSILKGKNGLQFTHFPIADFQVVSMENTQALVKHLAKRLRNGERILVHCKMGHGRTGTIVIPTVAALYDIDCETSQKYLYECGKHRVSDIDKHASYPETPTQWATVKECTEYVRHR
jgi:protein-tyrosine phosphatase